MTIDQIRTTLHAKPFKPFIIRTGGGREHRVPHPDFLFIFPSGRMILVVGENGAAEIIDTLLVESLHVEEDRKRRSRRGNGT